MYLLEMLALADIAVEAEEAPRDRNIGDTHLQVNQSAVLATIASLEAACAVADDLRDVGSHSVRRFFRLELSH